MTAKQILIIDDDAEYCEELADLLKDEGHAVRHTSDSSDGEILIRDTQFDVLILDYKMPGFSGEDILRDLKKRKLKSSIIVVSGRPFIEKKLQEADLTGLIKAVLTKPLDLAVLLEKIKSA